MSKTNENPALRALNAKARIQEGTKKEQEIAAADDALTQRLQEIQKTQTLVDSAQQLLEKTKEDLDQARQDLQEMKKEFDAAKINLRAAKDATTKATEDINTAVSNAKTTVITVDLNDQAKKSIKENSDSMVTSLSNAIDGQKGQWAKMFQSQKEEVEKMCQENSGVYCSNSAFSFLLCGWLFVLAIVLAAAVFVICMKLGWFH